MAKSKDLLDRLPKEGFIKIALPPPPALSGPDKAALIRKGNELFNSGRIAMAEKIFLTLRYTDGIVRLGDYYFKHNNYLKAYALFKAAPDKGRMEAMAEKMAHALKSWLDEPGNES